MEAPIKVLSIWQPWASLLIHGHKHVETRGWTAPRSLIGKRIGIAATSQVKRAQRIAYANEDFQQFYSETGLPELDALPLACLLGSVLLASSHLMDEPYIAALRPEELAFGWFAEGRHGWHITDLRPLAKPLPVRGAQGFWNLPDGTIEQIQDQEGAGPPGPASRRDLHNPVG